MPLNWVRDSRERSLRLNIGRRRRVDIRSGWRLAVGALCGRLRATGWFGWVAQASSGRLTELIEVERLVTLLGKRLLDHVVVLFKQLVGAVNDPVAKQINGLCPLFAHVAVLGAVKMLGSTRKGIEIEMDTVLIAPQNVVLSGLGWIFHNDVLVQGLAPLIHLVE